MPVINRVENQPLDAENDRLNISFVGWKWLLLVIFEQMSSYFQHKNQFFVFSSTQKLVDCV